MGGISYARVSFCTEQLFVSVAYTQYVQAPQGPQGRITKKGKLQKKKAVPGRTKLSLAKGNCAVLGLCGRQNSLQLRFQLRFLRRERL